MASNQILEDLFKAKGADGQLAQMRKLIRPERQAEFMKVIKRPANFLKHADRDPEETLNLPDNATAHMLLFAIWNYKGLGKRPTPEMAAYESWFYTRFPAFLKEVIIDEEYRTAMQRLLRNYDPTDFEAFRELIALWRKMGLGA